MKIKLVTQSRRRDLSERLPALTRVAQALLLLQALTLFLAGISFLIRDHPTIGQDQAATVLVMSILMFVDAGIFLWLGWVISKRARWHFNFSIAFVFLNIVLTVTDNFGIFDLIALLVNIAIISILFLASKSFFPREKWG